MAVLGYTRLGGRGMGGVRCMACLCCLLHCGLQDAHELFQVLLSSLDEELVRMLSVCCVPCMHVCV